MGSCLELVEHGDDENRHLKKLRYKLVTGKMVAVNSGERNGKENTSNSYAVRTTQLLYHIVGHEGMGLKCVDIAGLERDTVSALCEICTIFELITGMHCITKSCHGGQEH